MIPTRTAGALLTLAGVAPPRRPRAGNRKGTGCGAGLLRKIFASVADYERGIIRERVVASLRKAEASGKHLGRTPVVLNRLRIERVPA